MKKELLEAMQAIDELFNANQVGTVAFSILHSPLSKSQLNGTVESSFLVLKNDHWEQRLSLYIRQMVFTKIPKAALFLWPLQCDT